MSIEKYLNEINEEVANEGIGLIAAGVVASPFVLFAGVISIGLLIHHYGEKRAEKAFKNANEVKMSKTTITAVDLYINNALTLKNKADNLFNKGKNLLNKYQLNIPDDIRKSYIEDTIKLHNDIKKFHDKTVILIHTDSEIVNDISLKNKIIKMRDVKSNCFTNRMNGDDIAEELDQLAFMEKLTDDMTEYEKAWHYAQNIFTHILASYRMISDTIPNLFNSKIHVGINKNK